MTPEEFVLSRADQSTELDVDIWLEHSGIKGMKWGIRRYQNADGSLTAEGKQRYSRKIYSELDATGFKSRKQQHSGAKKGAIVGTAAGTAGGAALTVASGGATLAFTPLYALIGGGFGALAGQGISRATQRITKGKNFVGKMKSMDLAEYMYNEELPSKRAEKKHEKKPSYDTAVRKGNSTALKKLYTDIANDKIAYGKDYVYERSVKGNTTDERIYNPQTGKQYAHHRVTTYTY